MERVRQRAESQKGERFTNLFSHLKVPLLRAAYERLRKDAAAGIDGETWSSYGEGLDARLQDLQERLQRGSYHPPPVRRVHIPKGDGRTRALGIPVLEDKLVQQAVRMLMEPIYERSEFLGFSYGYRPGRSAHQALDALYVALHRRVNWVLDADIQAFFDTLDHAWMKRFLEHRIGDRRLVRLLMKWLKAGVMDQGQWQESERGTPQGGVISPLLANIYLHYVLDLWVHQWRKRHAHGEVYVVRYADDVVMGFESEQDARTMAAELSARLKAFGLTLHPDKTRVLRFGHFAQEQCAREGRTRPETFDFLGLTHICARSRKGRFVVARRTSRGRRKAKLATLKQQMRTRIHQPVREQHRWLSSVLRGPYGYYGVSGNIRALGSFAREVEGFWHRRLQRRSQRGRWTLKQVGWFRQRFALPPPRIVHPSSFEAFDRRVNAPRAGPQTQGGSPVREIRSPGSVRGAV